MDISTQSVKNWLNFCAAECRLSAVRRVECFQHLPNVHSNGFIR